MPSPLRLILWITLTSMALGACFALFEYHPSGRAELIATALHGAMIGGLTAGALSTTEFSVMRRGNGAYVRRLPFLLYFGLRSVFYLGVILAIQYAINRLLPTTEGQVAAVTRVDIAFSLALSLAFNLLISVNDLLGPGVLFAFAAGRYHRPQVENRALLFIDMRGSTGIAERLGEIRFLDFLNLFMADVSIAIAEAGGEIHKYVGDEVIATWKLTPGKDARVVEACFSALDRLGANRAIYERDFGERADFRAGLHAGPVVVGELGYFKKEIALIGDTMNTAARIEEACREGDHRVLASGALLAQLAGLPPGVASLAIGPLKLRGKERSVDVFAMEKRPRDLKLDRDPGRARSAAPVSSFDAAEATKH